jgi:hypothetical protein
MFCNRDGQRPGRGDNPRHWCVTIQLLFCAEIAHKKRRGICRLSVRIQKQVATSQNLKGCLTERGTPYSSVPVVARENDFPPLQGSTGHRLGAGRRDYAAGQTRPAAARQLPATVAEGTAMRSRDGEK